MKRWIVRTTKGETEVRLGDNSTADDVALAFSLRYCGDKGRVLEIRPYRNIEEYMVLGMNR